MKFLAPMTMREPRGGAQAVRASRRSVADAVADAVMPGAWYPPPPYPVSQDQRTNGLINLIHENKRLICKIMIVIGFIPLEILERERSDTILRLVDSVLALLNCTRAVKGHRSV